MRRLALLLATTVLGTGCIVTGNDTNACVGGRTITVDWPTFIRSDGAPISGCTNAGVTWIDVYMDGTLVQRFNCLSGGATITDVAAGSYAITVEGLDVGGTILYRHEFSATAPSACGDSSYVAEPGEGLVDLSYVFSPTNACTAGGSYMWFEVVDLSANVVTARVEDSTYACRIVGGQGGQGDVVFPVPESGSLGYRLNWFEERLYPNYAVAATDCAKRGFTVTAGQTTIVTPTLMNDTVACPP